MSGRLEMHARVGEAAGVDGPTHAGGSAPRGPGYVVSLSLATLGVVYGDIGTSPLYAMRECFFGEAAVAPTPANVLGVLSLIVWTLIVVISIKYLAFILRADNRGEGGIMALMALVGGDRQRHPLFIFLGLFGAALLYGDGMITPAISVLSAVEGLGVATEVFHPYIVPITVVLLIGLFVVQRHGTARVGSVFGPVTLVWFVVLAMLGIGGIMEAPQVLAAVSPTYAIGFFMHNGASGFFVLGGVFLVTTGGEALYADMGHFGKRPIRLMWFAVVLPGLLLNYFGQGALLLRDPDAGHNPFYHLAPEWALYPLVTLAAMATIIASQAIISGAFSLTRQAIRLGYSPPLEVTHTSSAEIGQIYIARVNWVLMVATIGLVLGFRSSSNLAAAYGVAVATTMVITTMLFFVVTRELWHWPLWQAGLLCGGLLAVDFAFFGANAAKLFEGGWFPVAVGLVVVTVMSTWKRGRELLGARLRADVLPIDLFLQDLELNPPLRVPGAAIFMTAHPEGVPNTVLHNLKHNKVLHARVAFLTIKTAEVPYVSEAQRLEVVELGAGISRLIGHYGFKEDPNVGELLDLARQRGFAFPLMETTFFLGRETLIPSKQPGMALWREWLFALVSRNAQPVRALFRIPPNRVVELGTQVEL